VLTALQIINPSVNSVPYTFILIANIEAAQRNDKNIDTEALWNNITTFLSQFDPRQMRYMAHELSQIVDVFSNMARRHHQVSLNQHGPYSHSNNI
jgi:COP9 signalosome complex subunit 3